MTLNVSELIVLCKRQRISDYIWEQDPIICCLYEANFILKKVDSGWAQIYYVNSKHKKVGPVLIQSEK